MRRARLAALADFAAMKRDADLAALADATAHLARLVAQRAELDVALSQEAEFATGAADLPLLLSLDRHAIQAGIRRAVLGDAIASQFAVQAAARDRAAASFGRATVLRRLSGRPAQSG